jgi:hypothetical protein
LIEVIISSGFPIEAFGNDRLLEVWEEFLRRKLRRIDPRTKHPTKFPLPLGEGEDEENA